MPRSITPVENENIELEDKDDVLNLLPLHENVEKAVRCVYDPDTMEWTRTPTQVIVASLPFAVGGMRLAFRMHDLSFGTRKWFVGKTYMDTEVTEEDHLNDVRMQMEARKYALLFNQRDPPHQIEMLAAYLYELPERKGRELMLVEAYIPGKYDKFSNNSGWVSKHSRNTPHAFSHFSFEASGGELIIVDIQGCMQGLVYKLTDPQIHSIDTDQWSLGNMGQEGIDDFFSTHVCNDLCVWLGLPPRMRADALSTFPVYVAPAVSLHPLIRVDCVSTNTVAEVRRLLAAQDLPLHVLPPDCCLTLNEVHLDKRDRLVTLGIGPSSVLRASARMRGECKVCSPLRTLPEKPAPLTDLHKRNNNKKKKKKRHMEEELE